MPASPVCSMRACLAFLCLLKSVRSGSRGVRICLVVLFVLLYFRIGVRRGEFFWQGLGLRGVMLFAFSEEVWEVRGVLSGLWWCAASWCVWGRFHVCAGRGGTWLARSSWITWLCRWLRLGGYAVWEELGV
uniref:Uncharacterized protein n=1 Tax=Physcomitrium patens TaxID=3218 RepID=A0A7I3ZRA8_PHYPA